MNFTEYKCIAILGGTFNPVHLGHTMMAKAALASHPELDKLIFMPNNLPAYKDKLGIIAAEHRLNMLRLAIAGINRADVSDMEIKRGGMTYTIDTLTELKRINPSLKIYFIIGADSLLSFHLWRSYEEILGLAGLLVIKRNKTCIEELQRCIYNLKMKCNQADISVLECEEFEASSSAIRADISNNNFPEKLLDQRVIDYIKNNNLYGC